jgi:hypothetical protein
MKLGATLQTKTGKAIVGTLAATAMFIGASGTAAAGSYGGWHDNDDDYNRWSGYSEQHDYNDKDCGRYVWRSDYDWKDKKHYDKHYDNGHDWQEDRYWKYD